VLGGSDELALGSQTQEALRWASEFHEQGMPKPADTIDSSIALSYSTVRRRFRTDSDDVQAVDESDLIASTASALVLGEPGSGKTTTLKRLTLSLFEEYSIGCDEELNLPLVIVCRLIDWERTSLVYEILARMGFDAARLRESLDLSDHGLFQLTGRLLDAARYLVVVDGLDEITDRGMRGSTVADLTRLLKLTDVARFVCSARSGEAPHLEGFSVFELLPLSREQIAQIAGIRIDAEAFLDLVFEAGIESDLLDRPLFLNQLLTVYGAAGRLPERPVDLYRQLLRLLIHDWDEQRDIKRHLNTLNLMGRRKREFLAAVAFELRPGSGQP
jgi:predicted NACHT family NTPase